MTSTTAAASSKVVTTTTTVSAPGKMLLAGGYLVLDEANTGLVVAVDKRFYCRAEVESSSNITTSSIKSSGIEIAVVSPQFDKTWEYQYDHDDTGGGVLTSKKKKTSEAADDDSDSNPLVEKTLRVALLYLLSFSESSNTTTTSKIRSITLTVAADNDFYSLTPHLLRYKTADIDKLPERLPAVRNPDTGTYYKTGLGSSACLVTAMTGALVECILPNEEKSNTNIVLRLSQIAHCWAQGKVGSGFDVSAAVYGSHVYRRFPKSALQTLLQALDDNSSDAIAAQLNSVVQDDSAWTGGVVAPVHTFSTTSFLQVGMADVSGGSESPGMARKILQWRQQQEQQSSNKNKVPHWDDLIQINATIVQLLQKIHSLTSTSTTDQRQMQELQKPFLSSTDWSQLQTPLSITLTELRQAFAQARHHFKAMGVAAGVPTEPDIQTALCDATQNNVTGVVAALVPGAGGFDAVSVVYINHATVRRAIHDVWSRYGQQQDSNNNSSSVCALTVQGADYGQGLRVEPEFPSVACGGSNNKHEEQ